MHVAKGRTRMVSWNCFYLCISMCVSVCLPLRALITSGMICFDIGRVWLAKPVVQVLSLLSSINCIGVALVIQCTVHARQRCQSWRLTIHRRRRISYLAIATRRTASFIKVSGWMRRDSFKRRLGFSFIII